MPTLLPASALTGKEVCNMAGETLGVIEDLMLDIDEGHIQYAVLAHGGFMGVGNKLFAIPIELMELDTENECFVLDVSKERLERAPGFDKDDWPAMADTAFSRAVYEYYGVRRT